ncbi:hypothetical protein H2204_008569 [Knufia peltigerae]|uniref:Serine carboxypeptidase n=1 Tax=Knufia peltigerae TaxID=1002370 RepID=A0AA38XZS6_9EURO|nr:hypothetical protein H2204_008569 [Knufia peltigerae]
MPLDHFHNESRYAPHTNDTFQQQYWVDTSNYVDGGPVIIHAMGEDPSSYDLQWLQSGLPHQIANATGGVAVLWGQRYYQNIPIVPAGEPYTTENLRFHSTQQAMADLAYFSQRVQFPGLEHKNLTAPSTPWIIIGGSYAGVISAFTRIQYPDLFWGGISSSGVTTAVIDNWQMTDVVRRYGPDKCISTMQQLMALMDNVFESGNKTAMDDLMTGFNVSTSSSYPDLQVLLTGTVAAWEQVWNQQTTKFDGPTSYCSAILNKTYATDAPASLQATTRALLPFANHSATPDREALYSPLLNAFIYVSKTNTFCAGKVVQQCLLLDEPSPFDFLSCTESGGFATGYTPGTKGHPSALPLASRSLTPEYYLDACHKRYNITYDPRTEWYQQYGGVNMSYPRLALSTGQYDFYRPIGPLAEYVPGDGHPPYVPNNRIKSNGTDSEPQIVIAGGYHEWDFPGFLANETDHPAVPSAVQNAKNREIKAVKLWLEEFNKTHAHS